jgi:hypothetical protein
MFVETLGKFKVGDRVQIFGHELMEKWDAKQYCVSIGTIMRIESVDKTACLDFDGEYKWFPLSGMEHYNKSEEKIMRELKVGDKVKIISAHDTDAHGRPCLHNGLRDRIGSIATIVRNDQSDLPYTIEFDDGYGEWTVAENIELFEQPVNNHKIPASDFEGKRFRKPKDEAECELYRKWFSENTDVTVSRIFHTVGGISSWKYSTVQDNDLLYTDEDFRAKLDIDGYIYGVPVETRSGINMEPTEVKIERSGINMEPTEVKIERSELTLTDIEKLGTELLEHVASIKNILNKLKV